MPSRRRRRTAAYTLLACLFTCGSSRAATEAHLIRVDARNSDREQVPILTTLIDVGEASRDGFVPKPLPGDAVLELDAAARPAERIDDTAWSAHTEPGYGTAWLVVLDGDRRMGAHLAAAKQIALELVASLRPNDAVEVVVLDDRALIADTKWLGANAKKEAESVIDGATLRGNQRNRGLATLIESAAKDGFGKLFSSKLARGIPWHQALVVLSSGYGGADPKTTGPGGNELARALEQGRFPENNTASPKLPIPVVSVGFTPDALPEHRHNAEEFMLGLANPRVGGSYRSGDVAAKSLVASVRARFDAMHVVRWRLPCVAPTPTQSLRLEFAHANTPIVGDATFRDVPLGAPLRFPLLIDLEKTRAEAAKAGGAAPGDRLRVYGKFCWASDAARAKAYFLPRGTLLPDSIDDADPTRVEQSRSELVRAGLASAAEGADPSFVELRVPSDSRIVGSGATPQIRLVIEDEAGPRTSGLTNVRVITIPARRGWPSWLWWLGGAAVLALSGATWLALRRR